MDVRISPLFAKLSRSQRDLQHNFLLPPPLPHGWTTSTQFSDGSYRAWRLCMPLKMSELTRLTSHSRISKSSMLTSNSTIPIVVLRATLSHANVAAFGLEQDKYAYEIRQRGLRVCMFELRTACRGQGGLQMVDREKIFDLRSAGKLSHKELIPDDRGQNGESLTLITLLY